MMMDYTVSEKSVPLIVVVGGANMDIGGKPDGPLREKDSNPGGSGPPWAVSGAILLITCGC